MTAKELIEALEDFQEDAQVKLVKSGDVQDIAFDISADSIGFNSQHSFIEISIEGPATEL